MNLRIFRRLKAINTRLYFRAESIRREYPGDFSAFCQFENHHVVAVFLTNSRLGNAQTNTFYNCKVFKNSEINGHFRSIYPQAILPWQCLYFLPEPQGHGSLRPTLSPSRTKGLAWSSLSAAGASSLPNAESASSCWN